MVHNTANIVFGFRGLDLFEPSLNSYLLAYLAKSCDVTAVLAQNFDDKWILFLLRNEYTDRKYLALVDKVSKRKNTFIVNT